MRAASSDLSRVYSRFDPGGVSTWMMTSELSETGTKPNPPNVICSQIAPTMLAVASPIIASR